MNRVASQQRVWTAFLLLALAWGTSFLFIKIAVDSLGPLTLVSLRLLIGLVGLSAIIAWRRIRVPRDTVTWRNLTFMGLINTALPFILITWAESGIDGVDSAVAAVLNSTVPLFSIVIAGALLHTEKFTIGSVGGVLIGFVGVVLLLSQDIVGEFGKVIPQLAVVLASLCYAISSNFARRHLKDENPISTAAGQVAIAWIVVTTAALIFENPGQQKFTSSAIGSVLWLGLVGSCLAYILYFFIIGNWGATRTTLVTYLIPVVGVTAGVFILGEPLSWQLLLGGLLILSGIALVNLKPFTRTMIKTDSHRAN